MSGGRPAGTLQLIALPTSFLARVIHVASSVVHIALLANKLYLAPSEVLCSGRLTTTPFAALRDVPPLLQTLGQKLTNGLLDTAYDRLQRIELRSPLSAGFAV